MVQKVSKIEKDKTLLNLAAALEDNVPSSLKGYLQALGNALESAEDCNLQDNVESLLLLGVAQAHLHTDAEEWDLEFHGEWGDPRGRSALVRYRDLVTHGELQLIEALKSCWR